MSDNWTDWFWETLSSMGLFFFPSDFFSFQFFCLGKVFFRKVQGSWTMVEKQSWHISWMTIVLVLNQFVNFRVSFSFIILEKQFFLNHLGLGKFRVGSVLCSFYDLGGHQQGLFLSFIFLNFFENAKIGFCPLKSFLARRVWYDFIGDICAVCFVVDASVTTVLKKQKRFLFQFSLFNLLKKLKQVQELRSLLSAPELKNVPVLILGNKIDLPEVSFNFDSFS